MSGIRSRHLERRCGIFGVRVRVPNDIRSLVGRVEVRRSLRTSDPLRARAQSALIAARLFEVFEMVKQQGDQITQEDIWAMIAQMFEFAQKASRASSGDAVTPVLPYHKVRVGPTVGEALSAYLDEKKPSWTRKTLASNRRKLNFLAEHLGQDTALSAISSGDIRTFRDAICAMRVSKGRCRSQSFASRQTENGLHRIDPKTAALTFEAIKTFFRWCKADQGYIATNPAQDIRISLPKKTKGKKSRRPFTGSELEQLFMSPLFTGCLSRSRRFEPGPSVLKDAKFWLPVLAYYTGARLGELVQLHIKDVELSSEIPFLNVTEENTGTAGTGDAKHVKSAAGVRCVPLHPDLIELGFDSFVRSRRDAKRQSKRLFHEVNFGSDGQASTVFSKFFGRLLDKVGLPDPALVFHSFRHGAEDALRNALQPQYAIDRIIGHSDGSTSAGYGQGVSLTVAHQAVSAMKLEVHLPELWSTQNSALGGSPDETGANHA